MKKPENGISISMEIRELIKEHGRDYRVCTSCGGPIIIPLDYCSKKNSDIAIKVGDNILYVSRIQYNEGLRHIGRDLI